MREITTVKLLRQFMELLGRRMHEPAQVYFTGGVTALLHGWRDTTVDVDLSVIPEMDSLLKQIPAIKEELKINVELAGPSDFIPELPGWKERSIFIDRYGSVSFYHYDPYAQALAKIERGHTQDVQDVEKLFFSGLVQPEKLLELFEQIEAMLYRFPAIDAVSFRRALLDAVSKNKT